ncbi:MAG: ATP-binding cassette domain-containing protein [Candidatus Omnitrophota bacterium]
MILKVSNISKYFPVHSGIFKKNAGVVKALEGVNFSLDESRVLGIVGESGSGKTTLARIIMQLIPPTSGEIIFGSGISADFRKEVQIIFQNPYHSLDPKMRIFKSLTEPFIIHRLLPKKELRNKAVELMHMVGMEEDVLSRYPFEFSGGQRQRICIARALASCPKLLILDEPISSLDLTVQAKMLDLFIELRDKLKLTYIFITHNLAVARHIADDIVVMQNGRVVEQGRCVDIFKTPKHPYTRLLLEGDGSS